MRRQLPRSVLLALLTAGLFGCAGDNTELDGGLGAFHDLTYEHVRGRLYDSDLSIEYVRATGEVPLRLTVDRAVLDLDATGVIDLGESGDITGSSGGSPLPPFEDGSLTLRVYQPGYHVVGEFTATFDANGTQVSATGAFDAVLEVVE